MKVLDATKVLLIALVINLCKNGGEGGGGKKGEKDEPKVYTCNKDVLQSYMLRGREKSNEETMFLCPNIKTNCCTKLDQQHIYHVVNDILPPRLMEYQSKIKMALSKLKALHSHVLKANPVFTGSAKRRAFCGQQARKVYNFPFVQLYNSIIDELELSAEDNKEHYQKFYCILCDGENHTQMDLASKSPKIIFDYDYCKEFLIKRADVLKLLNIELVEYLVSLQNLVDCTHYVKSYNLNFFDMEKLTVSSETSACINYINSKNFLKYCKPVCERVRFSKITEAVDGDYEFIIDAVNLFEKFFEYKETGNFISMKLRLFFKKFVIPRALTKTKKARFLHKLKAQAEEKPGHKKQVDQGTGRKLKTAKKGKSARSTGSHKKAGHKLVKKASKERKLFLSDNENPGERYLPSQLKFEVPDLEATKDTLDFLPVEQEKAANDKDTPLAQEESQELGTNIGRVLEGRHASPRKLSPGGEAPAQQPGGAHGGPQAGHGAPGGKENAPHVVKPKITAKLVFDKDLKTFYDEIPKVMPDEKQVHIFKIQSNPIDFDKIQKSWVADSGINPEKYAEVKFDMDKAAFYKLLFQYRKPDQVDPNLAFFLADFTLNFLKDMKIDLRTDFKIDSKNFNIGKIKKSANPQRVLATSPERYLREDFARRTIFGSEQIHP